MLAVILKEAADNVLRLRFFTLGDGIRVDVLEHECPQPIHRAGDLRLHAEDAGLLRVVDHVFDERVDPRRMGAAQHQRNISWDILLCEDPGAHGVVNVVVDVGDAVGHADDLPLPRLGDERARVAEDAHAHLVGEVQAAAVALELVDHAERLLIVVERAAHHVRQRRLTRMAERRVTEVVPIGCRLGEVLVQTQPAADRACDARDLERMRHARAVMVALRREEDLRLVHQPPERLAM